jgi:hypothetical protein
LVFIVDICLMMSYSTWLLCRLRWWHLLAIQESFALLQIMSSGMTDPLPLLYVSGVTERPLLLLLHRLLLVISMIFVVSTILVIGSIDLSIVLLLLPWWPLFHDSRSRARASEASMQTSTTVSRSTTVLGFSW